MSHCCTTCANSDIEMAPILMSVALQVAERDANVDIKRSTAVSNGENDNFTFFLLTQVLFIYLSVRQIHRTLPF